MAPQTQGRRHSAPTQKRPETVLKWEKLGPRTWYGEDGWLRYHVERSPDGLYKVARGGVTSAAWFATSLYLKNAKDMAQTDATTREDKLLALPSVRV